MVRAGSSALFAVSLALAPATPTFATTVSRIPAARLPVVRDCRDCPELVAIPAGQFLMGTPQGEEGRFDWDLPPHKVGIRAFAIGKFDVTRREWAVFVAATHRPAKTGCAWTGRMKADDPDPIGSWSNVGFKQTDRHPVVCVTWDDVQAYLGWLSGKTGRHYRLPSEAEWEYAARAGTPTPFYWGMKASHELANYGADKCCSPRASERDKWTGTSPVGAFPPNAFGLYDMAGNVLQMVQDCLSFTADQLPADGTSFEKNFTLRGEGNLAPFDGEKSCNHRVVRGGDWGDPPAMIRTSFRNVSVGPDYLSGGLGFRVARGR